MTVRTGSGTKPASCGTSVLGLERRLGMSPQKLPLFSNLSSSISSPFYTLFMRCDILMTGSHHSSLVNIPLLLTSNSSPSPLLSSSYLPLLLIFFSSASEFGAIIIMTMNIFLLSICLSPASLTIPSDIDHHD